MERVTACARKKEKPTIFIGVKLIGKTTYNALFFAYDASKFTSEEAAVERGIKLLIEKDPTMLAYNKKLFRLGGYDESGKPTSI